ncbi:MULTISPECIES: hypothetical protein [Brucella/Ochrobactrum group]|uniref:hypothetical protein n=1 Tax=Brucella/Ochrobactrum group TaxID=2826938 RepID=UPI00142EC971|nr:MULTISPECIES: hypothetical protein [Brucella/Ochrobactrum group]WPM81638.1 hypothetical protein R5W60_17810 [Brucella pseudintermedia]
MTGLFGQNPLQPDGENLAEFAKPLIRRHAVGRQGVGGGGNVVHETVRNQS